MSDTIAAHGVLVVPRLFDHDQAARLLAVLEHAFDARRAAVNHELTNEQAAWFEEVPEIDPVGRGVLGDLGMNICDSPRGLFELLEVYREVGLLEVVARYFGERVALMPEKCTLRRMLPWTASDWQEHTERLGADASPLFWHQDGRMFGEEAHALDVWVALSPCGRDAPGLALVPKSVSRLLAVDPVRGYGSVAFEAIADALPGACSVLPEFQPGDAVFLDQFTLHSTGQRKGMDKARYSVETWFFGESAYPHARTAFLV